ncbi:hypothetical protein [uncultured Oscillibacter sp.]|uniref:hypothetical protein n=1 Tax=uncultured Oscillibacter sp. TaxID=876091 RepID=UPI0025F41B3D|nr:hypothetical protein [uncultured Oscillibacter sp.]
MTKKHKKYRENRETIGETSQRRGGFFDGGILDAVSGRKYNKYHKYLEKGKGTKRESLGNSTKSCPLFWKKLGARGVFTWQSKKRPSCFTPEN